MTNTATADGKEVTEMTKQIDAHLEACAKATQPMACGKVDSLEERVRAFVDTLRKVEADLVGV